MKALEQWVIRSRARLRLGRARLAGGAARPARAELRLDDLDAPGKIGAETLDLEGWYDAVVGIVEWAGALPIRVVARGGHPLLPELIRFGHRLECPVSLRTSAAGIDVARAQALVDAGLAEIRVRVAGVSNGVQRAVLRETAADTHRAIAALLDARRSRGSPLRILVEVPVDPRGAAELPEIFGAARASGIDGVALAAPWRGVALDAATIAAVEWARTQPPPFHATAPAVLQALLGMKDVDGEPGVPRRSGACPVGAVRLEVRADGAVYACPFIEGRSTTKPPVAAAWEALSGHRAAIRGCGRACAHPDLLP